MFPTGQTQQKAKEQGSLRIQSTQVSVSGLRAEWERVESNLERQVEDTLLPLLQALSFKCSHSRCVEVFYVMYYKMFITKINVLSPEPPFRTGWLWFRVWETWVLLWLSRVHYYLLWTLRQVTDFLSLSFFTCKMGVIISTWQSCCKYYVKYYKWKYFISHKIV